MKELVLALRKPVPVVERVRLAKGLEPTDPCLDEKVRKVLEVLEGTDPESYHWILNAAAYRNPWRPVRRGWKNVMDQILHAGYAGLVLLPMMLFGGTLIGPAAAGFLVGGIREAEQYFKLDLRIEMWWDRIVDTAAFVAGGCMLYYLMGP